MFNTVARIAGIAVLGGLTVFGVNALTGESSEDPQDTSQPVLSVADAGATPVQRSLGDATDLAAGTISDSSKPDMHSSATTTTADDLFSTDAPSSSAGVDVDDKLAALGAGGVLGDSVGIEEVRRELGQMEQSTRVGAAADSVRTQINSAAADVGAVADATVAAVSDVGTNTRAILSDLAQENVGGAETVASAPDVSQGNPGRLRGLPNRDGSTETGVTPPLASASDTAAASSVSRSSSASVGATAAPAAAAEPAARIPSTPAVSTGSIRPSAAPVVPAGSVARVATRGAVGADKPDDGRFFVANARRLDKPDDGAYFTATDTGPMTDPCLKADGTAYIGPGTALNPFAADSPCLPKATAQSFDVAGGAGMPLATDSGEFTPQRDTRPTFVQLPDTRTPFVPFDPNFRSDYSSL